MKICEDCQREFIPSVSGQEFCLACLIKPKKELPMEVPEKKGPGRPPKSPQETLAQLDTPSFEEQAASLMKIAGVKKMRLDYNTFSVTIEAL